MPKKATTKKTTAKKKTTSKKVPKSKKKTSAAAKKPVNHGNRNASYILVIMTLVTVIIVLLNKYYPSTNNLTTPDTKKESNIFNEIPKIEKEKKIVNKQKEKDLQNKDESIEKQTAKNEISKKDVKIYFIRFNENSEKTYLSSVKRKIASNSLLKGAIYELIKGPSNLEEKKGILTAVPSNLKLRNITVKNRTAVLDFNGIIENNASGDILLSRLDQIVYTATQFENIDNIILKINGKKRNTLGSDGLSINGPIHRRK